MAARRYRVYTSPPSRVARGGPRYYVAGPSGADGRRPRRFFPTRTQAEGYAHRQNLELERGGAAAAQLTEAERAEAAVCLARLRMTGESLTLTQAVEAFLEHRASESRSASVEAVYDAAVAERDAQGLAFDSRREFRDRARRFVGEFGRHPVGTVSPREITAWLQRTHPTVASRNQSRKILSVLFAYAVRHDIAERNPVQAVPKGRQVPGETRILSPTQLRALMGTADPRIRPVLALEAWAGIRPGSSGEIGRLRWEDLLWQAGIIHVRAAVAKTCRPRNVPIYPALRAWLEADTVGGRAGRIWPVNGVKLARAAFVRAGLGGEARVVDVLRHTFCSYWLARTPDVGQLALVAGNSEAIVRRHYHRPLNDPGDAEEFWERIRPADP